MSVINIQNNAQAPHFGIKKANTFFSTDATAAVTGTSTSNANDTSIYVDGSVNPGFAVSDQWQITNAGPFGTKPWYGNINGLVAGTTPFRMTTNYPSIITAVSAQPINKCEIFTYRYPPIKITLMNKTNGDRYVWDYLLSSDWDTTYYYPAAGGAPTKSNLVMLVGSCSVLISHAFLPVSSDFVIMYEYD